MTKRQAEILAFVRAFISERGYSPSQTEIADAFNISQQSVSDHLTSLAQRGALRRTAGRARNIELNQEVMP